MLVEFTQRKDSYQPSDRLWLLAHTTKGLVSHKLALALDSVKFSAGFQSHGIFLYKLYEEKSMDNGQLCEKKWWTSRFLIMAMGALEHYTSTISRIITREVLSLISMFIDYSTLYTIIILMHVYVQYLQKDSFLKMVRIV